MHPQKFQALYFLDAQRFLELQHIHGLMAKHHNICRNETYEPIRHLARAENVRNSPGKPFTSFNICDILSANDGPSRNRRNGERLQTNNIRDQRLPTSYNSNKDNNIHGTYNRLPNRNSSPNRNKIIRPWSRSPPPTSPSSDEGSEEVLGHSSSGRRSSRIVFCPEIEPVHSPEEDFIDVEHYEDESEAESDSIGTRSVDKDVSPLDALMAMSSKTFQGLESYDHQRNGDYDHGKSNIPKKKRKTRTAFTNQQIYELEKRFIMQKYLTPADRDEISAKLGLSCAQVITWFQNRRAKFKRDIEEMKNDVSARSPETRDQRDKEKA